MRLILQLCLCILVLLGARTSCWGRMVCHEPATTSQAFIRVSETDPDASPMGVSSGEWLGHVSEGIEDGPNLYAYVKQNPWTAWDPDGLSLRSKVCKFVKTGGDWAATFADCADNLAVLSATTSPVEAFCATWSLGSELLPVSAGEVKQGWKWGKKALGFGDDANDARKRADNVAQFEKQKEAAEKLSKELRERQQKSITDSANKKAAGRKGNDATREQNAEMSAYTEKTTGAPATGGAGGDLPETYFPPTAGSPKGRFADNVNTDQTTNQRFITQTVDTTASGGLTKPEIGAAVDIAQRMNPGDVLTIIPKIKPPPPPKK